MKTTLIFTFLTALFLSYSCTEGKSADTVPPFSVDRQIQKIAELRTEAEKIDDVESFLAYYDENAISMPEYQPELQGTAEIEAYYKEIFRRQNIKTFHRNTEETIHLGSTIIEIGNFKKEYTPADADTLLTQNGKYLNVWELRPDGNLKLKGEAFGFFHHVENPETLVVQLPNSPSDKEEVYLGQNIPFELRAYNALNEKYVRLRDGALRSEFYTHDAKFMPFAEPTVSGTEEIKPYLTEYSSRGRINIDSIAVYTYHYENLGDHLLEYAKFKVKWSAETSSGRTEGKGIRIWKRQEDKSLKIYRQIGTHNHLD